MLRLECFNIQLLKGKEFLNFDISSLKPIHQLMSDVSWTTGNAKMILADPFLFVINDTLYLFYEEKRVRTHGVLMMSYTKDLVHWSKPVVVLQENFHLSFPWVFEDGEGVYMIPESSADHSLRLYKADNKELTSFSFVRNFFQRMDIPSNLSEDFVDSSILKKDGYYYLFTTVAYDHKFQMDLYVSHSLEGEFKLHPCSPICISQKYGRAAGSVIEQNGKIYRVAQDCVKRYGDNIHLIEIDVITPTEYREYVLSDNLLDTKEPFYKWGGASFKRYRI